MSKSNHFLVKNLFSIKNKICLVTGSEGGMGKQVCALLKKNGAIVIGVDKSKSKKKNYYQVDISNKEKLDFLETEIKKRFSKIDAIVNLAGVSDPLNFENNFRVNLFGIFNLTTNLISLMKKKGGSIINITSLNAELGFTNNPGYNSSKGALKLLTKSMAVDYGKYNIRVNNLGPGYIKTKMTELSYKNKKQKQKRIQRMIIKRYGNPSDLFGAIIYLISDCSNYLTGQDIYIDGGLLSKGI